MKLALLADVHANLEALEACLAHADARGADSHAFLGDLVGYGADPAAVVEIVESCVRRGAIAVRGNHDAAAVNPAEDAHMNRLAATAIAWTRGVLSHGARVFLSGLPLVVRRDAALFVHASADAPGGWTYVSGPVEAGVSLRASGDASYVLGGHVHEPMLYYTGAAGRPLPFEPVPDIPIPVPPRRRWLAIAGSVGQPRSGRPAACYAMLDLEAATLTFHRVGYDWRAAAAKVRAAGLPERLALRIEHGK